MKLYGGIDLHSNNSVTALLDEEDKVVYRRRLPNDLQLVLTELAPYREAIEGLVVESTYNWYWLVDGLMEAGYRLHLANTAAIMIWQGFSGQKIMQLYDSLFHSPVASDSRSLSGVSDGCRTLQYIQISLA